MSAPIIQSQYDQLNEIAHRVKRQSEQIEQIDYHQPPSLSMKHYLIFVSIFVTMLVACNPAGSVVTPSPPIILMPNEQLYAARDTGQITIEDDALRIGVGNMARESYIDAHGNKTYGLRIGLWFFFKEQPENDMHLRAYEGQTIKIPGYSVRVIEINPDDRMIVLGITPTR